MKEGLPNLRRNGPHEVLRDAFAKGNERFGFRLVHYSVQKNHLHMIVEAKDRTALSKGLQGLFVRVARGLNRLWERKGSVFADRYHDVILKAPKQVRNALLYVIQNVRRHRPGDFGTDPFSTGPWFDGWREHRPRPKVPSVAARAHTWLLRVGWRKHGLLSVGIDAVPG